MVNKIPSPQGVVVPVEPTREMWAAGGTAACQAANQHHDKVVEGVWSAMLAAAPAPSSLAGGEVAGARARMFSGMIEVSNYGGLDNPQETFMADLRTILAALSPEAPARERANDNPLTFGMGELVVNTGKFGGDNAVFIARAKEPGKVGAYTGQSAFDRKTLQPGELVMIFPTEDQVQVVANALVGAITPRHEAPATPSERELDLLDAVMRAGGIVKTAAALPDKAAHLSLLTDALNRADAILTEGLNSAPVSHEAPAEGAGEVDEDWVRGLIGEAVHMKADDIDGDSEELCRISEAVLDAIRPFLRSSAPEAREGEQPALTVWYGSMPESNGRENWTATIRRVNPTDKWDQGFCFARSEYPERVRYEADRMRWIIGELAEKPDILAYDADLHSGYVAPSSAAPSADKLRTGLDEIERLVNQSGAIPKGELRSILAALKAEGAK